MLRLVSFKQDAWDEDQWMLEVQTPFVRSMQALEKSAELKMRKIRIVARIDWPLTTRIPGRYNRAAVSVPDFTAWMVPAPHDETFVGLEIRGIPLEDESEFPPLVGMDDSKEWVEFHSADDEVRSLASEGSWCMADGPDLDVRSHHSEDSWCALGTTAVDRMKSPKFVTLDFKAALCKSALTAASTPSRKLLGSAFSHRVVQAIWREDVLAEERERRLAVVEEDEEEADASLWDESDLEDRRWWGRQVWGLRKANSLAKATMVMRIMLRKTMQRRRQAEADGSRQ